MTRHKSLASAMSALLAYKNRPEGEPVPVKTNWSVVASNDNEPEVVAEMGYERIIRMTPSVSEIMRQVASGEVERGEPTEMVIVKGDDARVVEVPGQIMRIGRLRFSNGEQIERGYKLSPDKGAVSTDLRMPAGSMLGVRDVQDRTAGGDSDVAEVSASNAYFNEMFGVPIRHRVVAKKKLKRNGVGLSRSQARIALAEAYANTPVLPAITKCPPGLPSAGSRIADSFVGMKKAGKGDTGSASWESIATALVDREIWAQALAELSERDRQTLDVVVHGRAKGMTDLVPYLRGGNAFTAGKRRLEAANENISAILKKVSA